VKLKILGSAAAEGWPGLFCECDTCREARELGGRNIRRRTAYAINDDLLVDFGPDSLWQVIEFGVDLLKIDDILFTHSHTDHMSPAQLGYRHRGYSSVTRSLRVHGNEQVMERLAQTGRTAESMHLELHQIGPRQSFRAGDYRVTAFEAQHAAENEDALNYAIEKGGRTLLIANDTGWWPAVTWEQVSGFRFDTVVLECTYGVREAEQRTHHLGSAATVAFRDELRRRGAIDESTHVVVNHFSHNGGANYDALCEWFAPYGIEVAYDGMALDV
jgi:phosphoribosyl 1,2-cyclic phosphate phosphodiesterase